jgi:hypothetical protein
MEIKTINLKGKAYAPVSERVAQFHRDHRDGNIETSYEFKEGYVVFKANVSFDSRLETNLPTETQIPYFYKRIFTGHAFGKIGQEKAFEKLESVAVGRALAFAGYLAGGEIASYDEIETFNGNQ